MKCPNCYVGEMELGFFLRDFFKCNTCNYGTFFINGREIPHNQNGECDCYGCESWRNRKDGEWGFSKEDNEILRNESL